MIHLCASHLGVAGTEVALVEDAALWGVDRFRAGDLIPTSFSEFMVGIDTVAKQLHEAPHER